MAAARTAEKPYRDLVLSGVLKALRRHRGMTPLQVSNAMGMAKRSYERFEAGEGQLRVERIFRFAAATDTDAYALLASVKLGSPEFALACADNKLAMLLVTHARELHRTAGADLARLQPQFIIEVLTAAFASFGTEIESARALAEKWLGPNAGKPGPEEET